MIYLVSLFILGLILGSFGNVIIYRLPKQVIAKEKLKNGETLDEPIESISFPASHCQSCKTPLKFYHNIPVISWIFLRGKCAFCKDKISIQYPLIELVSGCLMAFSFSIISDFYIAIILGCTLLTLLFLSMIDLKYKAVPSSLLYISLALSIIYGFCRDFDPFHGFIPNALIFLENTLFDAFILGFVFFILRFVLTKVLKKEAMGEADIYIAAVIGAVVGIKLGFAAIYISALLCLPAFMIANKKDYELPFIPFLNLGLFIALFFKFEIVWFINEYIWIN